MSIDKDVNYLQELARAALLKSSAIKPCDIHAEEKIRPHSVADQIKANGLAYSMVIEEINHDANKRNDLMFLREKLPEIIEHELGEFGTTCTKCIKPIQY